MPSLWAWRESGDLYTSQRIDDKTGTDSSGNSCRSDAAPSLQVHTGRLAGTALSSYNSKTLFYCNDELHIREGLICRGQQLVLPTSCQEDALEKPHGAHRGIVSCKSEAREALY